MTDGPAARLPTQSNAPEHRPAILAWLLNPYVQILIGALLATVGEVLLAKGARLAPNLNGPLFWLAPLASRWTWIGIIAYILSLLSWLYVLRTVPLSVAFPLINVVHVFVPLGAKIFLHETVPPRLWGGISLVLLGVLVIARPLMKAEKKL
ncbi:MAG TPA: EamA family transporter [Tepidisphaeraceae bacterium]|jgi:drug/metabolite transporter (DMT)-like permease|nr:EamA family transporter [Tepidisphaeraceae bacterium]